MSKSNASSKTENIIICRYHAAKRTRRTQQLGLTFKWSITLILKNSSLNKIEEYLDVLVFNLPCSSWNQRLQWKDNRWCNPFSQVYKYQKVIFSSCVHFVQISGLGRWSCQCLSCYPILKQNSPPISSNLEAHLSFYPLYVLLHLLNKKVPLHLLNTSAKGQILDKIKNAKETQQHTTPITLIWHVFLCCVWVRFNILLGINLRSYL